MMTNAVAVEEELEIETAKNAHNAALARWVEGIKEDLKAIDAGTLQTEPLEDFIARRKEYWRKMKEENAGAFNPAV